MENINDNLFACLVVGSRTFNDYALMKEKLDKILKNYSNVIIISGGASGADSLAERYAKEHNFELKAFPADWSIGKSAGYIRNIQMHEYISLYTNRGVVAFWDGASKGTQHNFTLCKKYSNPLRIVKY